MSCSKISDNVKASQGNEGRYEHVTKIWTKIKEMIFYAFDGPCVVRRSKNGREMPGFPDCLIGRCPTFFFPNPFSFSDHREPAPLVVVASSLSPPPSSAFLVVSYIHILLHSHSRKRDSPFLRSFCPPFSLTCSCACFHSFSLPIVHAPYKIQSQPTLVTLLSSSRSRPRSLSLFYL